MPIHDMPKSAGALIGHSRCNFQLCDRSLVSQPTKNTLW